MLNVKNIIENTASKKKENLVGKKLFAERQYKI